MTLQCDTWGLFNSSSIIETSTINLNSENLLASFPLTPWPLLVMSFKINDSVLMKHFGKWTVMQRFQIFDCSTSYFFLKVTFKKSITLLRNIALQWIYRFANMAKYYVSRSILTCLVDYRSFYFRSIIIAKSCISTYYLSRFMSISGCLVLNSFLFL